MANSNLDFFTVQFVPATLSVKKLDTSSMARSFIQDHKESDFGDNYHTFVLTLIKSQDV